MRGMVPPLKRLDLNLTTLTSSKSKDFMAIFDLVCLSNLSYGVRVPSLQSKTDSLALVAIVAQRARHEGPRL